MRMIGPYDGERFVTERQLKNRLSSIVAYKDRMAERKPYEFESLLLGEALIDRHHAFKAVTVAPTRFGFVKNLDPDLHHHGRGKGRTMSVYFKSQWCIFSYHHIVSPLQGYTKKLFELKCRDRWQGRWQKEKKSSHMCVRCRNRLAADVDHIFPSHAQIRDVCWTALNDHFPDLKHQWWASHQDPLAGKARRWNDTHPLTVLYDQLTQQGSYQSLCKYCHRIETRNRAKDRTLDSLSLGASIKYLLGEVAQPETKAHTRLREDS